MSKLLSIDDDRRIWINMELHCLYLENDRRRILFCFENELEYWYYVKDSEDIINFYIQESYIQKMYFFLCNFDIKNESQKCELVEFCKPLFDKIAEIRECIESGLQIDKSVKNAYR
jgi:hypothetical protein